MFDNLSSRLETIFKKLRSRGVLNEANIQEALREVRLALLEADVNFKVVRDFIEKVKERAIGQEVLGSLTPGQQFIKIVKEKLTELMGSNESKILLSSHPPTILMLVGLQGSGKTTTCAKLARQYLQKGHRPLLVAADVYRPAAQEQLAILASNVGVSCFKDESKDPVAICLGATREAQSKGHDLIILDTAGRLHINEELMEELRQIKARLHPHETLLVVDAMSGQDAVNVAKTFNDTIGIDGVILTKLDGDARGGAALSIRYVTGKPIKMVGVGEKVDQLESFFPDRMASRLLGMGDILTLIEKAEKSFDETKAKELEKKLREESFTLEDFREQLREIKKMGSMEQILSMIPGMGKLKGMKPDEKELVKVEAIINSMTKREREDYTIIDGSRRRRIAKGSGTEVYDVNKLLKQFAQTKKMMKMFTKGGKKKHLKFGPGLFPF